MVPENLLRVVPETLRLPRRSVTEHDERSHGTAKAQSEEMLTLLERHKIQVLLDAEFTAADVAKRTGVSIDTVTRPTRDERYRAWARRRRVEIRLERCSRSQGQAERSQLPGGNVGWRCSELVWRPACGSGR